jgi:hypothetical protein
MGMLLSLLSSVSQCDLMFFDESTTMGPCRGVFRLIQAALVSGQGTFGIEVIRFLCFLVAASVNMLRFGARRSFPREAASLITYCKKCAIYGEGDVCLCRFRV